MDSPKTKTTRVKREDLDPYLHDGHEDAGVATDGNGLVEYDWQKDIQADMTHVGFKATIEKHCHDEHGAQKALLELKGYCDDNDGRLLYPVREGAKKKPIGHTKFKNDDETLKVIKKHMRIARAKASSNSDAAKKPGEVNNGEDDNASDGSHEVEDYNTGYDEEPKWADKEDGDVILSLRDEEYCATIEEEAVLLEPKTVGRDASRALKLLNGPKYEKAAESVLEKLKSMCEIQLLIPEQGEYRTTSDEEAKKRIISDLKNRVAKLRSKRKNVVVIEDDNDDNDDEENKYTTRKKSDVVISYLDKAYKDTLYKCFRSIGTKAPKEAAREVIAEFKRKMGSDGRFLKKCKNTRHLKFKDKSKYYVVDEKKALQDIKRDIGRRDENINQWGKKEEEDGLAGAKRTCASQQSSLSKKIRTSPTRNAKKPGRSPSNTSSAVGNSSGSANDQELQVQDHAGELAQNFVDVEEVTKVMKAIISKMGESSTSHNYGRPYENEFFTHLQGFLTKNRTSLSRGSLEDINKLLTKFDKAIKDLNNPDYQTTGDILTFFQDNVRDLIKECKEKFPK